MKKKYRSWTAEQKLAILKEIDADGVVAVSRGWWHQKKKRPPHRYT